LIYLLSTRHLQPQPQIPHSTRHLQLQPRMPSFYPSSPTSCLHPPFQATAPASATACNECKNCFTKSSPLWRKNANDQMGCNAHPPNTGMWNLRDNPPRTPPQIAPFELKSRLRLNEMPQLRGHNDSHLAQRRRQESVVQCVWALV
jgi:hypothetical protein